MSKTVISHFIVICYLINIITSSYQGAKPTGHLEPLGSHQEAEGSIEELWQMTSATEFYNNYISTSKPLILRGAAKSTDAFKLWTDDYLREKYGHVEINVDYGKKENRERPADTMILKDFLDIYKETPRYLIDSLPRVMQSEFQLPNCILCGGITQRLAESNLWFSSGGTKSYLHIDNVENMNCLLSGEKHWFFIDKNNSQRIEIDHGEGEYCGVDVDKVDMIKYPSLKEMPWWSGYMYAGDCIYVPYGWAHQVRSFSRNIAVNVWWAIMKTFNYSDCDHSDHGQKPKTINEYQFTPEEQIRFLMYSLLEDCGGELTYDFMHKMIRHEHTGRYLLNYENFCLLDNNNDGVLTAEEIDVIARETIAIVFQHTPPGEINIKGMAQNTDSRLLDILAVEKQEPYIEEFLLRPHKTKDEIKDFLETQEKNLHINVKNYIQEILDDYPDSMKVHLTDEL